MFKKVWKWFLQGIVLVAPAALTIALLYWLGSWAERTVGSMIAALLPEGWYFRGIGLVVGFLAVLAIGLAGNIFLIRWVVSTVEHILDRIPLIKSLVQAFKDVARLFTQGVDAQLGQVVTVEVAGAKLIGFITQHDVRMPVDGLDQDHLVAVYMPMSYQLGGYTVYVTRDQITTLNIPVDQAMRAVLTGGSMTGDAAKETSQ